MALTNQEREEALASAYGRWRKSIPLFAQDVFGSTLRAKQIEFCEAFQRNKRITFKGGVGFGKTHVLAIVTWWSLFCHPDVKVTIFGPNEAQLKNGLWNEVIQQYERIDASLQLLKDQWDVTATRVSLRASPASCYATFMLANKDNVASVRGIHADNNFILVDEATGIADEVFEGALQNHLTTDLNPKLALISNPKATSGFFWRTWNDDDISDIWTKVHGRMSDNPRVTEEDLRIAEKQYGGKGSNDYIIHVEGDFPTDSEEGLISSASVNLAIDNPHAIPAEGKPIIWGVDPAGPGKDRSVILMRHDNKVLDDITERRGLGATELAYLIRDMFMRLSPAERSKTIIAVDANGVGHGVYSILSDFGMPVREVMSQSKATKDIRFDGKSRFARLRDQMWWSAKEWIESEAVSIPNSIPLIRELKQPTYAHNAEGRIKVEGKDEIKKRLKMSPDYADALCLTFAVDDSRYVGKYSWSKAIQYGDLRHLE